MENKIHVPNHQPDDWLACWLERVWHPELSSPVWCCFDQPTTAVNSLLPCHPVAGCLQHREPLSPSIVSVDIWMNDHWLKDEVCRKPTETPWVFTPKIPNARVSWQFSCYSGNEGPIDLCESMWNVVVKTEEFRSHNFGVDWYECMNIPLLGVPQVWLPHSKILSWIL